MSYLHLPRLVFTGDFISDVSTVNNDPQHYNLPTFKPSFQEYGQGATNGWWNPEGGAIFNFQDCQVVRVTYQDGSESSDDEMIGMLIEGPQGRSAGKMVDLDPQQQMVSELWAAQLRLLSKKGELLLQGDIHVTAFRDLQMRQHAGAQVNGQPLGACWTSVLENLVWGKQADQYRYLRELKAETQGNRLSINLNAFGYYYSHAPDGRFSLGRMLGALGPWYEEEPLTFIAERRLFATQEYKNGGQTTSFFQFSDFMYDPNSGRLAVDLGRSFPVNDALGNIGPQAPLVLGIAKKPLDNAPSTDQISFQEGEFIAIAAVPFQTGDWLMKTGGIVDMAKVPKELAQQQLLLLRRRRDNSYTLIARESVDGLMLRADDMVLRLDTGDQAQVRFYACQWGQALDSAKVSLTLAKPTKPQKGSICIIPGNNYPADGLGFSSHTVDIQNGKGQITLTGNAIHNPRGYIDGQIYFVNYQFASLPNDPANQAGDALSIHLRDYFPAPKTPTWSDIQEIMQQNSNLYPIMSKYIVDLGNRDAVLKHANILIFAFSQDIHSPLYMPVTRDLSESKRLTILRWLEIKGAHDDTVALTESKSASREARVSAAAPAEAGAPSEFHAKLIQAMKMKMGKDLSFAPMDSSNL